MLNSPIKFIPLYQYRIWGGDKLKTELNKTYNEDSIGESWEISDVKGYETKVSSGKLKGKTLKQLIHKYKGKLVGKSIYNTYGDNFPLLIKFIDSKTPLSIQVHPNNTLAKERHNSFGKNEMWYVIQADEDAELIVGFNKKVTNEIYINNLNNSTLTEILNIEKVKKGDTYFIPAGRVHAIGAGVLLAEIQQTSDITYRIYDYDRVDSLTGKKRKLHNDLALDSIDFEFYEGYKTTYINQINSSNKLVHSPYFKTNFIPIKGELEKDYSNLDSFVIYMCVDGCLEIEYKNNTFLLSKGETILLPAIINQIILKSDNAHLLEVYL